MHVSYLSGNEIFIYDLYFNVEKMSYSCLPLITCIPVERLYLIIIKLPTTLLYCGIGCF